MANQSNTPEFQEIDISIVSKKVRGYVSKAGDSFFNVILFFKRYAIAIIILIILGGTLGYFMDKSSKSYIQEVYVIPNFKSVDYLYSKVEHVESKIMEHDTMFFKEMGIDPKVRIGKIEIDPVVDIYDFIKGDENRNYDMLRLMSESNDINKVMEEDATAKNYKYHLITIITRKKVTREQLIDPLIKYFNDSDYYKQIQKEEVENLNIKIAATDSTLHQIDNILNDFSGAGEHGRKAGNLIYYNDNTQIHEVVKIKNKLTEEQAENRIDRINYANIIKESSLVLNNQKEGFLTKKMKYIVPFFFILIFAFCVGFINYYKRQMKKRRIIIEMEE